MCMSFFQHILLTNSYEPSNRDKVWLSITQTWDTSKRQKFIPTHITDVHACVCNVFDRIIAARLNWFVEKIWCSKTTKLASQEKDRSTMGHVIRL